MARELLPDALWDEVAPLIPPHARRFRYPGRLPSDHRKVLTGILFVLRTGIPWEDLPQEMGCGCGMTCWNHLAEWKREGVWDKLHQICLAKLQRAGAIDWSRAVVDSASLRAVFGGRKRVPIPRIARKRAASIISLRTRKASRSPRS